MIGQHKATDECSGLNMISHMQGKHPTLGLNLVGLIFSALYIYL